jgi:histidinol-phosphate aminotransferase
LAQYAAIEALKDKEHVGRSIKHNLKYLPILAQGLKDLGFFVSFRAGNFVLATRASYMPNTNLISEKLAERGIIIRAMDNYDLTDSFRITVGTKEEIALLLESLKAICATKDFITMRNI